MKFALAILLLATSTVQAAVRVEVIGQANDPIGTQVLH